ncbi:MAG TPA: tetratricopeptide repeat protein [Bacteroidota bacterium]|nr:tetratricopeptide repeat protein [Bacteroidota bacterium]
MPLIRSIPFLLIVLLAIGCDSEEVPADTAELFDKAVSLFEEESYRQAEMLFTQALVRYEQAGALPSMAVTTGYLGRIGLALGEFGPAIEHLEQGVRYAAKANDFREEMRLQVFLGNIYREMGEYDEAVRRYKTVQALAVAFNDGETKAETDYDIALTAFYDQQFARAREHCELAVTHYRTAPNVDKAAQSLMLLGDVFVQQGKHPEALNIYRQAASTAAQGSDPLIAAKIRLSLGRLYRLNNNPQSALQQFREAVNELRAKRIGRPYEAILLFEIGNIYFHSGQYENAKRFYTDASAVARALGDRISENLYYLLIIQCNERLAQADRSASAAERVARTYRQLTARFAEHQYRTGEVLTYVKAAMLYEQSGLLTTAREMYLKALALIEDRQNDYASQEFHAPIIREINIPFNGLHRQLAEVFVKIGSPGEALAVLDRGSMQNFHAMLQRSNPAIRHPQLKDDVERARTLLKELRRAEVELTALLAYRQRTATTQRVNRLRQEIAQKRTELTRIGERTISLHPNYEPLLKPGRSRLVELQSHIPRGTLLVQFLPTDSQLTIFALSRSRFEVKTSPITRRVLGTLMAEYRQLLHDPRVYAGSAGEESIPVMTRFANLSTELYDHLIRPVETLLDRNLVIIADQMFEGFPLHALERQDAAGVKYLVQMTSVDYLPSLSSLRYKTLSAMRIRDIVAVGNPTGKQWSIDYELRDIRSFFKEANIVIGLEASWETLRKMRGDVLQLATEFMTDESQRPWGSILLSDGQTPERSSLVPFERLSEVAAFPVVYLSNQSGSGMGLSAIHALLLRMNGTSDVFFNAWSADRKAGKFFSEYFYTYLSNGLAPGDAYRQALLSLIKTREVNHPRSWGQFFHYGVG